MRRVAAPVAVGVAVMIVALAACATRGSADDTTGGPATLSPIPITANPSALQVGGTISTGTSGRQPGQLRVTLCRARIAA